MKTRFKVHDSGLLDEIEYRIQQTENKITAGIPEPSFAL